MVRHVSHPLIIKQIQNDKTSTPNLLLAMLHQHPYPILIILPCPDLNKCYGKFPAYLSTDESGQILLGLREWQNGHVGE